MRKNRKTKAASRARIPARARAKAPARAAAKAPAKAARKTVPAIPPGFRTVTPFLVCRNAGEAIEFYERAFGATEFMRMAAPGGGVAHAEIKIGDSFVMLTEENEQWGCKSPLTLGGTPASLHLYVKDVDAAFARAVSAGCTAAMPVQTMFWGDRFGKVKDPFGHDWSLATHVEEVAPAECQRRSDAFFAQMAQNCQQQGS